MPDRKSRGGLLLALVLILALTGCAYFGGGNSALDGPQRYYYAVESDSVICGYAVVDMRPVEVNGEKTIQIEEEILFKIVALGAAVESKLHFVYQVDPRTNRFFYHEMDLEQGSVKLGSTVVIEGDTARITSKQDGKEKLVELPPGTVLENSQIFLHLVEDFVKGDRVEKKYRILNVMDGLVSDMVYTREGRERIFLAGREYDAVVLDKQDLNTGIKLKTWIDSQTGYMLKIETPSRNIYLADESVVEKITSVDVDKDIFAPVNVAIPDIKAISYIKVKALMQPTGAWITVADLNIPGQSFTGTVEGNLVEGIFEVSHPRYDGTDAPPFPPDFKKDVRLSEYLQPADMIESDHPEIIKKAQEITAGSPDSWEAMIRLSKWVSREISYDIPGGGSALNTFKTRLGECGAHSRLLAALCRAAGIPARVVWGCMYVPNQGGSFGQHGWNEVYMGSAGWLPVDCTAEEFDYADSGHIRLGALQSVSTSFGPRKMELLDYRLEKGAAGDRIAAPGTPEAYLPYIGKYQSSGNVFQILVKNGGLAIDIPGQMVYELKNAGEDGLWYFKLSDRASVSFQRDETGQVTALNINELVRLPRDAEAAADEGGTPVPGELLPYIGSYKVPMQNLVLGVVFQDGNLAVSDPRRGTVPLQGPDESGYWANELDQNRIKFDSDSEGRVTAMIVLAVSSFARIDEGAAESESAEE
ncbi:MAG: transglutaminase domain-containing protein [Candidatus Krumholzibacteriota bacterium]|nr:transglutaminase domain-containing protein [Candidatus Krumholzibacteriota bacterium]